MGKTEIAEELRARAAMLRTREWVSGSPKEPGQSCLIYDFETIDQYSKQGAGGLWNRDRATTDSAADALEAFLMYQADSIDQHYPWPSYTVNYNDKYAKSVEDVVAVLEKAAAWVEETVE